VATQLLRLKSIDFRNCIHQLASSTTKLTE
jgi:hypothetical protein